LPKKQFDLIIDNCFNPLFAATYEMGCALGSHFTKLMDGQGRVLGGITVGDPELIQKIYLFSRLTGPSCPFNAWVLSKV
jgi:O-succinylhomoserine sulfhydrylase